MYTIEKSALVSHRSEDMFGLVNDVARYEEFLPWCGGSQEHSRNDEEVIASVTIAYKEVRKTFTTKNTSTGKEKIVLSLVDGPFSDLNGVWTFLPLDEHACKISFRLDFSFSNILVEKMIGPIFKSIANSMIDSFCTRADELYGKK